MVPIRYNLRSLAVRKATTFATALGIGLVVFVLAASLMLSAGIKKTLGASGHDDIAIVTRKGADNELSSSIEEAQVGLIAAQPGVKKKGEKPLRAAEIVVVASLEKIGAAGVSNVQVRGVEDDVLEFRPTVKIVAGHAPKPASDEVMVGARINGRFQGVELGKSFELKKNRPVTVVGVFEDAGSSYESEVWVALDTLRASFGREGTRTSVRVQLESAAKFDSFRAAVEADKRIGLQVARETAYYEKQSEGTSLFISVLGTVISVFFSIGAIIGAAITMYAAVANRAREIGILRALGFSKFSITLSFILESIFLSMMGGVVGVLASMALGTVKFSMMNFASGSEIVFGFEMTRGVMFTALIFSFMMGLLGGLLPAIRASRTSPVIAMRGG